MKAETLAKPAPQRIVIKVNPKEANAVKEAFSAAAQLREAGYVAELEMGAQKPVDLRWVLDVQSKVPLYTLRDTVKLSEVEAGTIGEVLKLLEEKGADKDSLA